MEYIIGGGITGLILSFLHPKAKVITEGRAQWDNEITLGPRYLHYSKHTEDLLKRLQLSINTRYIQVGYQDGDRECEATEDFLKQYSLASGRRGQQTNATMNGKKDRFKIFTVSENELAKKLHEIVENRGQIINKRVTRIKNSRIECKDESKFKFSRIYSTIPINVLTEIMDLKMYEFKYAPIYFRKLLNVRKGKYDMVYCINKKYYRYTFTEDGCIAESVYVVDGYFYKLKFGKIIYNEDIEKLEEILKLNYNINLVGRYARHDPRIKINDIIEQEMRLNDR